MPWKTPTTLQTGHTVTAQEWNDFNGAGGNFDFLCDGQKIASELVRETSMKIENAPVDGATLEAKAGALGGFRWRETWEDPMFWMT